MSVPQNNSPTAAQLKAAAEILEQAAANRALLAGLSVEDRTRLLKAAGDIYCPDVAQRRRLVKASVKQRKAEKQQKDDSKLHETGIRKLRREKVFTTPNCFPPLDFKQEEVKDNPDFHEAVEPQNCYVCKKDYSQIHHFYDQLCPACAELNFRKRSELADLRGRVALLTGGRVKIGYQAGIKLLRAGAQLIVCTRFPRDSAIRYAAEPDFKDWGHRLEIFGLDLRHTPSVEAFCKHLLTTRSRLDFIINNACQTVRRPPDFYEHMMERENGSLHDLPADAAKLLGAYEGLRGYHMLPEGGTAGGGARPPRAGGFCLGGRASPRAAQAKCRIFQNWPVSPTPPRSRKCRCCPKNWPHKKIYSPKASSTRICSRWICASAIPGGCSCTKFRPWNCSKCSLSTPSRPSSSTRVSSR
jgi:hypothetical protein